MVIKEFARFAVESRRVALPVEVERAAARALIDWYAATVAGAALPPARILRRTLLGTRACGSATLVPDRVAVDPRTAALINATASHTVELDDIFREGLYHPGSPTVGAALAAAEHLGSSGADLLRAIAIGYEIGDRIAEAVQPDHYTFWHTTGTVGTIGAAAAVADLLGLQAPAFAHAMATATTNAAGLQQAFRSDAMSKPLHAGHAADAGLLAAFAAAEGFTGALDILEGDAGFGAAMSTAPDWAAALAKLGRPWGITQATVKSHCCCGHTFAAVDAALELRPRLPDAREIDRIHVETYTTATKVAGNPTPVTAFEAKFSIQYCVAAALVRGSLRPAAFEPAALADPQTRRLMESTEVTAAESFDRDFPGKRRATVTVLAAGATHTAVRDTRKGDPDDPVTDDELDEKFRELTVDVLGAAESARLLRALRTIGTAPSLPDVLGAATERAR